jgi:drug/metabolite transporter (DMT)-like permease
MLCGSLAFAGMGTMAHELRHSCPWQVIALARAFLPLVIALVWARTAGVRLVFWKPGILWLRSIAGSLSMVCTFFALTRLPVSDVFTLNNLFPIWVALLSWPLLNEVPSGTIWVAVASGIAGVVLVQQPHLAEGNFAVLLALASSLSTALAMIGLHRLQGIDARAIVVHFSMVSLLFCLGAFFTFDRPALAELAIDGRTGLLLLGVGVMAVIGQLFLTLAFIAGPATKVSVVGLTQIVFAMILEVLIFDHSFSATTLFGMTLILAPTAWLMAHQE